MYRFCLLMFAGIALVGLTNCVYNPADDQDITSEQIKVTTQTAIWSPPETLLTLPTTSSVCSIIGPTSIYTGIPVTKPAPPEGTFCEQNVSYVTKSGLTVTIDLMYVVACGSCYELHLDYRIENKTDKILDEEIFKAYFADGSRERQTGLFGIIEPGQTISNSYLWVAPWGNVITLVEFEADFDDSPPMIGTLKWKPPTS